MFGLPSVFGLSFLVSSIGNGKKVKNAKVAAYIKDRVFEREIRARIPWLP